MMFGWVIFLLVVAAIAAFLGLRGVASIAARIALVVAAIGLLLFIAMLMLFGWADSL